MEAFDWVALDASGLRVEGRMRAAGELDLDRKLETRGLTLTRCRRAKGGARSMGRTGSLARSERIHLTTQLATMVSAGIRVVDALESLAARLERPAARRLVEVVVGDLRRGRSLSQAMARHPRAFPPEYCASIRAAEASGELSPVLERLGSHLSWMAGLRATTIQALIYPALLCLALSVLITVLMTFVIPNVVGLFPAGRADLPQETRVVLALSDFLVEQGLVLVLAAGALALACVALRRRPTGRAWLDNALLAIPRFGGVVRQVATTRFAATASLLQAAGCDVSTVLGTAGAACGHAGLAAAFERCAERTRQGSTITAGLEREGSMDPLLLQLVSVGEATGSLERTLSRLVEHYDEDTPRVVQRFLALFEPCLLLLFGGVVAFVLMAAMLPMFSLYEAL